MVVHIDKCLSIPFHVLYEPSITQYYGIAIWYDYLTNFIFIKYSIGSIIIFFITFISVLLALEGWLLGKNKQFLLSAGAAIVIFRAELAMLFGLYLIIDIYFKKIDVTT